MHIQNKPIVRAKLIGVIIESERFHQKKQRVQNGYRQNKGGDIGLTAVPFKGERPAP
jgi:hypothetical protein